MSVREFKPEKDTMVEDLRRYADQIEKGELTATTGILIFQDRVKQNVFYKLAGEVPVYSAIMGLLAYASHMMYKRATE